MSVSTTAARLPRIPQPSAPAIDIADALAATERALQSMTDPVRFEDLARDCLVEHIPTLRLTGGAGDRQRDGEAGPLLEPHPQTVLTVSLQRRWKSKVKGDLDGLAARPHPPTNVVVASSRPVGRASVLELIAYGRDEHGFSVQILGQRYFAGRLLERHLLHVREDRLGLPPPLPPVTLDAESFRDLLPNAQAHQARLHGRDAELKRLAGMVTKHSTVAVVGAGGQGKTRLLLALADRVSSRVRFVDDRARLLSPTLPSELAGADDLLLVVDNAHRRSDLRELVAMLERRSGDTKLVFIARPGYWNELADAVDGTRLGPLMASALLDLGRLPNAAIKEVILEAAPRLEYEATVQAIVGLAEGNPQIALLGHRVAADGGQVEHLGADDVLSAHAQSLVRSSAEGINGADERDVLTFLGVVAALSWLAVDDAVLDGVAELLDMSPRRIGRVLGEIADAGLVVEQQGRYAISPDILSGHLLWSAFFVDTSPSSPSYAELWTALPAARSRMCDALGGLPREAVEADNPDVQIVATDLMAEARRPEGAALTLTQACAPGLPWLAERVIDVALEHLPSEAAMRLAALRKAAAALQRTPTFSTGWPRQLRVASEICALESDGEAIDEVAKHLTGVYQRLPVNRSANDGQTLAWVQTQLVEITEDYWDSHRGRPGVAHAVALASRLFLTVSVEHNTVAVEDENIIRIGGGLLPASPYTERVLAAGVRLFAATLADLPPKLQQQQIRELEAVNRASRGLFIRRVTVPDELKAMLARTVTDLNAALREVDLSVVNRSSAEDYLGPVWSDDPELDEFRELFADSFDSRRDIYNDAERAPRAQALATKLLSDPHPVARLLKWQEWMSEAKAVCVDPVPLVVRDVLEQAADADPSAMGAWFDELFQNPGPLLGAASGAFAVVLERTGAGTERAQEAAASPHAQVRACLAWALSASSLTARRTLMTSLAGDEDAWVRDTLISAIRFGEPFTEVELGIALAACMAENATAMSVLLWHWNSRQEQAGQPARLTSEHLFEVRRVVLAVARLGYVRGRDLERTLEAVPQISELAFEFCLARVEFLAENEGGSFEDRFSYETLPDEIAHVVRAAANDQMRRRVMDRIAQDPRSSRAHVACRELFEWVDDGGDLVTERLIGWLADEGDLNYEAKLGLEHEMTALQFKERARHFINADPCLDVDEYVLNAREPSFFVGSRRPDWRRLKSEYQRWVEDDDPRLAALGRQAVRMYEGYLASDADLEDADAD